MMPPLRIKIFALLTILSAKYFEKSIAIKKTTCFACNTYMTGFGDSRCLEKNPNGISECETTSYGDCLTMRVFETFTNGQTEIDGEKGCIYPSHIKCFMEATGEKLVLGSCLKVHMTRHAYTVWDKCFQQIDFDEEDDEQQEGARRGLDEGDSIRNSFILARNSNNWLYRQQQQVPTLPTTEPTTLPTVATESTSISATLKPVQPPQPPNPPSPVEPPPPPKPKVTDRYFEYCVCKGKYCNDKDTLKLTEEEREGEEEEGAAARATLNQGVSTSTLLSTTILLVNFLWWR